MDLSQLSQDEKNILLKLAREALEIAVRGDPVPKLDLERVSPALREAGASFVTLTSAGFLRGCIGALEPYQSLAEDVREHAVAAALDDPRFAPVQPDELPGLDIEISRLTPAQPLEYSSPLDLIEKLRPGMDGVILKDNFRRATYLPQVWEKIPDPVDFLDSLCLKMGSAQNLWRRKHLQVSVYQVESFSEPRGSQFTGASE